MSEDLHRDAPLGHEANTSVALPALATAPAPSSRLSAESVVDCKRSLRLMGAASWRDPYSRRLTISFFSSAIALAGFSPFGHAFVQFKIVWQR